MNIGTVAAAVFPVITLIIGHLLATRSDRAKDERAADRERVARAEQRRHRILERRAEFQRSVLVELQDVAIAYARATGAGFHEDMVAHRRQGAAWGSQQLSDGVSDRHAELQRRLNILIARIGPGAVQERAKHLADLCNRGAYARSESAASAAMSELGDAMTDLNEEVGRALRRLDALEDELAGTP